MTSLDPPKWYRQRPDFVPEGMLPPEVRIRNLLEGENRRMVSGITVDDPKTRVREDLLFAEPRDGGLLISITVPDTPLLQLHRIPHRYGALLESAARPTITLSAILNERAELLGPDLERTQVCGYVVLDHDQFEAVLSGQPDESLAALETYQTASGLLHERYGMNPRPISSQRLVTLFMHLAYEIAQHYETGEHAGEIDVNGSYQGITAPLRSRPGRDSLERIVRNGSLARRPHRQLRIARTDRA